MKHNSLTKLAVAASAAVLLGISTQAQTLLYQWTFNGGTGTPDVTAGGGNLSINIISGLGSNLGYNNVGGPGIAGANGALTVSGGGYNSGNSSVAIASDLTGLGTLSQLSIGFWFNIDASIPAGSGTLLQLPRFVEFGASATYDAGGKGSGNFNGIGTSMNYENTSNFGLQNGVAGATGTDPQFGPNPGLLSPNTWYYELVTYDGTSLTTYIGSSPTTMNQYGAAAPAAFGAINFGASATVMIGNDNVPGTERALSTGSIADVEIWSGLVTPVPEPATLTIAGLGMAGLLVMIRRRRS
jgi:hypothetical protein